jgi:hypothetical protein
VRAWALAAILGALCACAPKASPAPVQLDCAQGFEALSAKVLAQPGVDAKPKDPGDNFRVYSAAEGRASYIVTETQAPSHPAILMQQIGAQGRQINTGCAFGDKAAFEELSAYINSLAKARR